MARIRTIKPEFWTDEDMAEVSEAACLLAIGLLNYADDEGYFNANPKLVKAAVFPIREPSVPITVLIQELSNCGYLSMYSTPDGRHFGFIKNFAKHQVVNKPKESKIKELELVPYEYGNCPVQIPPGRERKGKDQGREVRERERVNEEISTDKNSEPVEPVQPEQPDFDLIGKFPITKDWMPGGDFFRQAALWGVNLGTEPGYSPEQLQQFRDYWVCEGKVFHQVQWEQKFAQSLRSQGQKTRQQDNRRRQSNIGFEPSVPDTTIPPGFN